MAFFNDFKDKFANAAQSITNKTKDSMEINRISGEKRTITGEISDVYEQLGKIYYESKGEDKEKLDALCTRLAEMEARLEELDRQKMQIRNQNRCPACGAVMSQNAKFCSGCGHRMPEAAPAAEAEPKLEDVTYCPECGAMRKSADRFCDVCGHNYDDDAKAEAAASEEPAAEAPAKEEPAKEEPIQETPVKEAGEDADEAPTEPTEE